jgi:hypothetical protein
MKKFLISLSIYLATSIYPSFALAQASDPAQSEPKGSAVREFFRSLLFCGPDGILCDP